MHDVGALLAEFKDLPKFEDGRINYQGAAKAPVINCVVKHQDEILLLKRSHKVGAYKNLWSTIGGYIDEVKPIAEFARQEAREELGLRGISDGQIRLFDSFTVKDREINKTWLVHPVLINVGAKPKVELDWEHTAYQWLSPERAMKLEMPPGMHKVIEMVIK